MNKKRWKTELELKNYQRNFSYVEELKHFLKCVKQKKETINDLEQGIEFDEIMNSDKGLIKWLELLHIKGISIVFCSFYIPGIFYFFA